MPHVSRTAVIVVAIILGFIAAEIYAIGRAFRKGSSLPPLSRLGFLKCDTASLPDGISMALAIVAGLLAGCQSTPQSSSSGNASSAVVSPDCSKIKLTGVLGAKVAALRTPPICSRADAQTRYASMKLTVFGRVDVGATHLIPDDPTQGLILDVRLYDRSYPLDELPVPTMQASDYLDFHALDPALRAELSSADTKVYSVVREDRTHDKMAWICVFAYKAIATGQTLDIDLCHPVSLLTPLEVAANIARLIVRDELPLITATR